MLNADLAIGSDIVIVVSCFLLTDKTGTSFFAALNAAMLAELAAVRGSGSTLMVIEPHSEFLVLTKHGTAMMDGDLVPEAYHLGRVTAVGEATSVRRVWNSHH
jgi:NTE family protein